MSDQYDDAGRVEAEAEQMDPTIGEQATPEEFVGAGPMSAEDPGALLGSTEAVDSDAVRDWREEPELSAESPEVEPRPNVSLLDDADDRLEAIGPEDGPIGPEDGALHFETDG